MVSSSPYVVGLTGGIGSGKSYVSSLFASLGVTIIDADIIARKVVAPGTEGLQGLVEHFGSDILTSNGELNRALLRNKVFSDPEEKSWLNAFLHPKIRQKMNSDIASITSPYGILVVPLLIENKLQNMVNRIAVVDCSEETQLKRTVNRDNSSEDIIKNIIASQASREQR